MIEFEAHYWEHQQHVKSVRKKEAQKLVRKIKCVDVFFIFWLLHNRKINRRKVLLHSWKMQLKGRGLRRMGWEKNVYHLLTFQVNKNVLCDIFKVDLICRL